jgi:hypothetical protein
VCDPPRPWRKHHLPQVSRVGAPRCVERLKTLMRPVAETA